MANALMIAAGGGGDAITAAVLGPFLGLTDEHPIVMTYAWDRLLIDPRPGPRSAAEFVGLHELAPNVLEILPTTRLISPAGSTLPRLAAEVPARLLLLDPAAGARGMSNQIAAAAKHFGCEELALVDVGGDVVTTGNEAGLRSPLADLLALAACSLVDLPSSLYVSGAGIDGEIPEPAVVERIAALNGRQAAVLTAAAFDPVRHIFSWHPSEASGLLAAAARGIRGRAEVRDAGSPIQLNDNTPRTFLIDLAVCASAGPALHLRLTRSLKDAQDATRKLTGISEIDYESRKALRIVNETSRLITSDELTQVDTIANEAVARGAVYVSVRRLAELLGVRTWDHLNQLNHLLRSERTCQYMPPLYRV